MIAYGKVAWRPGARISGVEPDVALRELERVRQEYGLTGPSVKEAARPAGSPLHPAVFDKGEHEAAEAYYDEKARQLVRALVEVDDKSGDLTPVYVHVEDVSAYEPVRVLVQQPSRWQLAYGEALRDLRGAQRAVMALDRVASEEQRGAVQRATEHVGRAVDELVGSTTNAA